MTKKIKSIAIICLLSVTFLGLSSAHASQITGTLSSGGVFAPGGSTGSGSISGTVGSGSTLSGTVAGGTSSGGGGGSIAGGGGGSIALGGGGGIPVGQLSSANVLTEPGLPDTGYKGDKWIYALMVLAIIGLVASPLIFLNEKRK